MKKEEVIFQVQNSLGSLFTKDDVIKCLNMVLEEPKVETKPTYPSRDWLDRIKNEILSRIKEVDFDDTDMYDVDGFEFDIRYGNQIEVNSYNVDARSLKTYVENEIEEVFGVIEDDIIEIQKCNDVLKEELERLNSN
jgi:hypothetical protein